MAGARSYVGTGSTVGFGTSSYDADLISVAWGGVVRASVESTPMDLATAPATFGNSTHLSASGHVDPGELTVEVFFDPALTPPIVPGTVAFSEVITLTFPTPPAGSNVTWIVDGFCTGFSCNAPFEDMMTATLTVKLTAETQITVSA